MRNDVLTISLDQTLAEAEELMEKHRIRRLPVMREEALVGIISREDVRKGIPASGDENTRKIAAGSKVEAYMTENPITVRPMDPLEDIALIMCRNKIGGIPVVEDGRVIGIITESDIFRAFAEILGAGRGGARVELKIDQGIRELLQIVKLCRQFNVEITAISVYQDFTPEHQLLTMRFDGEDVEELIDALWQSGCRVNRVLRCDAGEND
jgi:acetoin utilization protein AcuB